MKYAYDWLPELILMEDYDGDWSRYLEAVHAIFNKDFIQSQPKFKGCWIRCRRDLLDQGKEAGFWHCISGGKTESERNPEPRRMERIAWVRAIIEHVDDPDVDVWSVMSGAEKRFCIWFKEEFLIVLAERVRKRDGFKYWQLITVYDTPEENRKRQLRKSRDKSCSKNS